MTDPPRRTGSPRSLPRRALDRFLRALVFVALGAFYREVDVVDRHVIGEERPILIVSNHFNGLIDPVVLIKVFGRLPRFLAKAALWDVRGVTSLCRIAGMIPIHRPEDGDVTQNRGVFSTCHAVLAAGDTVGIFPEGDTHDVPSIQSVHTGAARIALGAHDAGAPDLLIVPVGLTFDDKLVLRSRVLAQVGEPIDVGTWVAGQRASGHDATEHDHDAVLALTAEIDRGMRAVAPDYADTYQARALGRAGEIVARTGREPGNAHVPLSEQEAVARRLAQGTAEQRDDVINALGRYQLDLELLGLLDHLLVPGFAPGQLVRRIVWSTVLLVVLAVPAAVGLLWNLVPYLVVTAVGNRTTTPVTKGTVRLSVALVVFPAFWSLGILVDDRRSLAASLTVLVFAPLLGLLAMRLLETAVRVRRSWRGARALRAKSAMIEEVLQQRAHVVAAAGAILTPLEVDA